MKVRMLAETTVVGKVRRPGEVLELPDGIAASLVQAGRAELVKAKTGKKAVRETATKEPPEKAVKE